MRLLPDKSGDVLEDTAKVKITRHYRFEEGLQKILKIQLRHLLVKLQAI